MLSEKIVATLNEFKNVVFDEKVLDPKTQMLAALAVSVAITCKPCTQHYYQSCKECGATNEEISAIIGTAMSVLAGKCKAYATAAIEELSEK